MRQHARDAHAPAGPKPTPLAARFAADWRFLQHALGLPPAAKSLAAWRVWAPRRAPLIRELQALGVAERQARVLRAQWRNGNSQCYPPAHLVLLASRRPAHVAEEAAHALRHAQTPLHVPTHPIDAFYMRAVEEALAFFASKLLCPTRRAPSRALLRRWASGSRSERGAARALRAHETAMHGEAASSLTLFPSAPHISNAVSHWLGYRLGDALHRAQRQGAICPRKVARLFARPTSGPRQAFVLYCQLTLCLRDYLSPLH